MPETLELPADPAAAIEALVAAHGRTLYNLGLRICGSPADAEEMVQETFLNAFRAWGSFEGRAKPSTWLFTIAKRVCLRKHRLRAGEPDRVEPLEDLLPGSSDTVADPAAIDPLDEQVARDAQATVERALRELPVDFRLPLVLVDIAELSIAETAEVLGLKTNTVKTRVHRARLKLRQALDRTLPQKAMRAVAPTEICLSMLQAKQEALDREVTFPYSDQALCERCGAVFAALDLGHEACRRIGRGEPPPGFTARLVASVVGVGAG